MVVQYAERTPWSLREAFSCWKCKPGKAVVILCIIIAISLFVYFGRGAVVLEEAYLDFSNTSIRSERKHHARMKALTSTWEEAIQAKSKKYKPRNFFKFIEKPISDSLRKEKIISEPKVILLWNTFSGQEHWIQDKDFEGCKIQSWDKTLPPCRVTENHLDLPQSDSIIVFATYREKLPRLPEHRLPHQHLVLYCRESPRYTAIDFEKLHGLFNSTATYRLDSDYVIGYGDSTPKQVPLGDADFKKEFASIMSRKTRLAVARISNCAAKPRIHYIHELQRYIPVDFFGNCGNTPCEEARGHGRCKEDHMEKYRFHFSFENNYCRDYITEKFWLPLAKWNSVPVVMGGENPLDYTAVAPPGSYINTADYDSPEHLAQYLQLLENNETLYEKYFHWRKSYEANMNILPKVNWCHLCFDLHNMSRPVEYYEDLKGWYEQDVCRK